MPIQIAVAGKGGTGKTSFCALLIRHLAALGQTPILAVDADANANLHEALGMEHGAKTVSELIEATKDPAKIPGGMGQDAYIEYMLSGSLSETKDVDLLVMGGPQGPGCYCYPNNILRKYLGRLESSYKYIVVDNEAGLEHISRRTTQNVDYMFVVSDASARSIRSAGRVKRLLEGVKTQVRSLYLVMSKTDDAGLAMLEAEIKATGLELAGCVPHDAVLAALDLAGRALTSLPADAPSATAVRAIAERVGIPGKS